MDCGKNSSESLKKLDRITPLSKTWRTYALKDLSQSCKISARSGTMRNGKLFLRPKSELPTSERESGLLPTPMAQEDQKSPIAHMAMKEMMNRTTISSLTVFCKSCNWRLPTPMGRDAWKRPKRGEQTHSRESPVLVKKATGKETLAPICGVDVRLPSWDGQKS